jgi:hypothetical protein
MAFFMLKRIFPLSTAERDRTRHDPIPPRVACDTDRAAPVWRELRSLEFQSAILPAIERDFDLPPACVSITARARLDG